MSHGVASLLCLGGLLVACAPASGPTTTGLVTTTTVAQQPTSTAAVETPPLPTSSTTTSEPTGGLVVYVVAEERSQRLAVFTDAGGPPCQPNESAPCGPFQSTASIDLPYSPHNLTAAGSVVWVTHPSVGRVSRVDLSAVTVLTRRVGLEPHDVKLSPEGDLLYVPDEEGRALLVLDPDTLEEIRHVDLPAKPHDLSVDASGTVWITLIGDDRLGVFARESLLFFPTGGAPHDLLAAPDGRVWFSNWNSDELFVYDPLTASVEEAPAGVVEPHHFAVDMQGDIWVSDNGGSAIVGFVDGGPLRITVGPVPHHIAFGSTAGVVAVSGLGEAVFFDRNGVIGRVPLSTGLHGVAVATLP